MSKNLAKLLNQPERLVSRSIKKLENLNGLPSEDVRVLAENTQAVRQKIASLGLDADDTTGEELYQALLCKYDSDSAMIDKALGPNNYISIDKRLEQAVALVKNIVQTDDIWVLKHNSAKKLLRAQPPKKLMKQLNFRSIESLLKRGNLAEIFSALAFVESSAWQRSFNKAAAHLASTDYELRAPEIIAMPSKHWQDTKKSVSANSLIGAVALWPATTAQKAPVLTLSLIALDGLEELTHSDSIGSIASVNPSLIWWEQSKYLVANCQGQAVSLNYKDIAQDHLRGVAYQKRNSGNGQQSLWNELLSRYQNQSEQLQESVAGIEAQAAEGLDQLVPKQPAKSQVVNYAEAIANEF